MKHERNQLHTILLTTALIVLAFSLSQCSNQEIFNLLAADTAQITQIDDLIVDVLNVDTAELPVTDLENDELQNNDVDEEETENLDNNNDTEQTKGKFAQEDPNNNEHEVVAEDTPTDEANEDAGTSEGYIVTPRDQDSLQNNIELHEAPGAVANAVGSINLPAVIFVKNEDEDTTEAIPYYQDNTVTYHTDQTTTYYVAYANNQNVTYKTDELEYYPIDSLAIDDNTYTKNADKPRQSIPDDTVTTGKVYLVIGRNSDDEDDEDAE